MTAAREHLHHLEHQLAEAENPRHPIPGREAAEKRHRYIARLRADIQAERAALADDACEAGGYEVGDPKGEALRETA